MEILIIQNSQLENYVSKIRDYLNAQGFVVNVLNVDDYSGNVPITTVPTFLIKKSGKEGYAMRGKQPLDIILNWAKNSGAGN